MRTVFIDVDTQMDFMFPAGALYVLGAEAVCPVIAKLNRFAAAHSIPLISTMDAHPENASEFHTWPPHCVAGTLGQQKLQATLLEQRAVIPYRRIAGRPSAAQMILEKDSLDMFTNPNIDGLLNSLAAERYVVYGVVTEICVRIASIGLLKRGGARVEVVTDAVKGLRQEDAESTLAEFTNLGGTLTTAAAICG